MEYLEFKTNYPKESHEIGLATSALLKSIGEAVKDGFQPSADIPAIITSAVLNLASAIQGYDKLPEEFKGESVNAAMGIIAPIGVGAQELLNSLKKKEEI